jgi:hypothetical protein
LCGSEIKEGERERESDVDVSIEFNGTAELTAGWEKYKTRIIILRKLLHTHLSDQIKEDETGL